MIFELDSRLRFDKDLNIQNDADGIADINIHNCSTSGNIIAVSFEAENRFTEDGRLGTFRVIVPENTPTGTYELAVRESGGSYSTKILMYNNRGAEFGPECFSLLQGGSITVTDRYYQPPQEQPVIEPEPPKEQVSPVDEQIGEEEDNAPETTSPPSTVSTSTSTVTTRVTKSTIKTTKAITIFSRALSSARNTTRYTSTAAYTEVLTQRSQITTNAISKEAEDGLGVLVPEGLEPLKLPHVRNAQRLTRAQQQIAAHLGQGLGLVIFIIVLCFIWGHFMNFFKFSQYIHLLFKW